MLLKLANHVHNETVHVKFDQRLLDSNGNDVCFIQAAQVKGMGNKTDGSESVLLAVKTGAPVVEMVAQVCTIGLQNDPTTLESLNPASTTTFQ